MLYDLVETYENWTLAVDSSCGIDAIYFDYSKAFDSVPQYRLVKKLAGYGIGGKLLSWLINIFENSYKELFYMIKIQNG